VKGIPPGPLNVAYLLIALSAALLAVVDPLAPAFVPAWVAISLFWVGVVVLAGVLLYPVWHPWWKAFRYWRIGRALKKWHESGERPEEYPAWVRRHFKLSVADARVFHAWEVERHKNRLRLRNTGADDYYTVTDLTPTTAAVRLRSRLELPLLVPRGASIDLLLEGTAAVSGVVVSWTRADGATAVETFYR
jgi:hypothetical protein